MKGQWNESFNVLNIEGSGSIIAIENNVELLQSSHQLLIKSSATVHRKHSYNFINVGVINSMLSAGHANYKFDSNMKNGKMSFNLEIMVV